MVFWYPDEGIQKLEEQWLTKFPNAVVYDIGDSAHSKDPRKSQHAPDDGKSGGPGDTKGEVDAKDFMPGKGVTERDLQQLFDDLHAGQDPRLLIVIYKNKIFSSVVAPWKIRSYSGKYHSHVHVSVNDKFENNQSTWKVLGMDKQPWKYKEVGDAAKLPEVLVRGMEDSAFTGYHHIMRIQALLSVQAPKLEPLTLDGVYGNKTTAFVKHVFGGTGTTLTFEQICQLHGFNWKS